MLSFHLMYRSFHLDLSHLLGCFRFVPGHSGWLTRLLFSGGHLLLENTARAGGGSAMSPVERVLSQWLWLFKHLIFLWDWEDWDWSWLRTVWWLPSKCECWKKLRKVRWPPHSLKLCRACCRATAWRDLHQTGRSRSCKMRAMSLAWGRIIGYWWTHQLRNLHGLNLADSSFGMF